MHRIYSWSVLPALTLLAAFAAVEFQASSAAHAADSLPTHVRFSPPNTQEIPDFQRHVLPLLGRLGCNGRACHGSFQGQGGFQLSLFGYDFAKDHAALTGGDDPRVDLKSPNESLILQKPTLAVDHDGGERFKPGGWEHRLLQRWIKSGAPGYNAEQAATLITIDLEPKEMVFAAAGKTTPLKVTARWSDGSQEDITALCRFRSNDESIAEVNEEGLVTSVGPGDTHIVAFYDNGIAAVPVILPVSELAGENYPPTPTPTAIDRLVVDKLRKVGLVPAELCTDAEFLRRVSLDLTGTLPAPAEIEAFLADNATDKRERKIDELLQRPTYAAWLATRLSDLTGNAENNMPVGGEQGTRRDKSSQWYRWLYRRAAENEPFDKITEGIVLAVSRKPDQSDEDYYQEMTSYFRTKDQADFSKNRWMPYFWTRGQFTPPQTLRFAYAFLGVRLECAECHKHPYDQWTQADYQDFQAFFDGVRFRQTGNRGEVQELKVKLGLTADQDSGGYKRLFADLAHKGTMVPWGDVAVPDWSKGLRKPRPSDKNPTGRVITPRLLGGNEVIAERYNDPRQPVMDWLVQSENPYFARAIVNRVWAHCFGVGIIEPPDDMNLANPASNEPLLEYLAQEFITHDFDLRWLHREITSSRTYQLSWRPNDTNRTDERNFSRAAVRRLPAEVTYDALVFASATESAQAQLQTDEQIVQARMIGFPETDRNAQGTYAVRLFGKPARVLVCDCERSNEPSLLQTIYLRNDAETNALLDRKDGWLSEVGKRGAAWQAEHRDELVREAWLRTFSRPPSPEELAVGQEQLDRAENIHTGLRDLLWALTNSKEFILNH